MPAVSICYGDEQWSASKQVLLTCKAGNMPGDCHWWWEPFLLELHQRAQNQVIGEYEVICGLFSSCGDSQGSRTKCHQ